MPTVRALSRPRAAAPPAQTRQLACATAAVSVLLLSGVPATAQPATARRPPGSLEALNSSLEELARRVGPAVVQVLVTSYAPAGDGGGLLAKERSGGSGVILDPDGYVVTNAHVVEGARRVQVLLPRLETGGGGSILRARSRRVGAQLVGSDAETDIAVLRVQERGLPALALGDSEALRQGQFVLAFGSPLGLENTLSLGVVSSVARQLEPDNPMIYVQTDAPINPGNSGGPLVDVEGRVVGINTLALSGKLGSEGLGFAAPSNIVRNVFEQIRRTGRVRRSEIGARAQTVTPALAAALALGRSEGVVVSDVTPGGGAAASGLEPGDLVLSLDGKPMENARQFNVNIYGRVPGGAVTLEILRGTRLLSLTVPVTERPGDPQALRAMVSPEANLLPRLGLLGLTLEERLLALLGPLRARAGVVVAGVSPDGPFWQDPVLPGDVIVAANRQPVASVEGLRALLAPLRTGDALALQVERRGQLLYLAVEIE